MRCNGSLPLTKPSERTYGDPSCPNGQGSPVAALFSGDSFNQAA